MIGFDRNYFWVGLKMQQRHSVGVRILRLYYHFFRHSGHYETRMHGMRQNNSL